MKIQLLSLFLFCIATSGFSQVKKWTLEEAVLYAIDNNIQIKQSEFDVDMAGIQTDDAFYRLFPNLNGSASYSSNTGANINPVTNSFENSTFLSLTTGLQTNVTLFSGLQNIRQLQKAKLQKIAAQYNLDKMKDDIALNVANAYLQILFNKENLKNLNGQLEITKQQLDRTNELVNSGMVPRGNLLEIEAAMAGDQQRIVVAKNDIKISLINLAQILLIRDYESFDIAEDAYDVPLTTITEQPVDDIIRKAKELRPEIKIAEQNLLIAEKDLQISRGTYYPTLSGFAGYNTRWADNDIFKRDFLTQFYENDGTFYGLQLQVPIFNGLSARNNVKRSKINIDRITLQKEQTLLDIEMNVYRSYTDVQGAYAAYQSALVAESAQQLAFQFTEERFNEGFISTFEVSQAKIRLENAQSETLLKKYDYIFKLKVLEFYFGIQFY